MMKRLKGQNNSRNAKARKISEENKSSSNGAAVVEICMKCETSGADVKCHGICFQFFHTDCIGISEGQPVCNDCASGKKTCFQCKDSSGELENCSFSSCNKVYHSRCLKQLCINQKDLMCPYHFCATCAKSQKAVQDDLVVRCIHCPIAYHNKDSCLAAGCKILSKDLLSCPKHFSPPESKLFQTITNMPWCSICTTGGQLIYCGKCPAAFHEECIEIDEVPEGFTCTDCISNRQLHYGSLVWAKIGSFRWWPSRIENPKDLPADFKRSEHLAGEFPVQYFGTKEYFWTHKGKVYPYFPVEDDSSENALRLSAVDAKYKVSVYEAGLAFEEFNRANRVRHEYMGKPNYRRIRVSKPVGNVPTNIVDISALSQCGCDPDGANPCGYLSLCLNRAVLVECHPSLCKAGNLCQNQMFQKRLYPNVIPFKTLSRGWALKTLVDIKAGHFIIEYIGDLISEEECKKRLQMKRIKSDNNYYFLTIEKDRIIDAGPKGNYSRFMNHSCDPNCETQKWIVNGDIRIGLFAKVDIPPGDELTFDYMMDSFDNEKLPCLCGAANCRGAIGVKTQNALPKPKCEPKQVLRPKMTKSNQSEPKNKKGCFLCLKMGKLVKCSFQGCLKSYHMSCLGRDTAPVGRWQCPRHHCATCGRLSKFICYKCTNAFCDRHKTDENMFSESGQLVCLKH